MAFTSSIENVPAAVFFVLDYIRRVSLRAAKIL